MAEVTAAATILYRWRRGYGRQTTLVWLGGDCSGRAGAGGRAARARVWPADRASRRAGRERATAERPAAGWPGRERPAERGAAECPAASWPGHRTTGWPGRPCWRGATWRRAAR